MAFLHTGLPIALSHSPGIFDLSNFEQS
jgi:hypothetical protein